jgi:hypothetical protein
LNTLRSCIILTGTCRRAKLKRLTVDDRERMMSSRALPDDFDLAQTLHSPFGSIDSFATMNSPPNRSNSNTELNSSRPTSSSAVQQGLPGSHVTSTFMRHPLAAYSGSPPLAVSNLFSLETPSRDDHFAFPNVHGHGSGHRTIDVAPISPPISLSGHIQSPQAPPKDAFAGNLSTLSPSSFRNEITSSTIGGLTGNEAVLQGFNPAQGRNAPLSHSNRTIYNHLELSCRCLKYYVIE